MSTDFQIAPVETPAIPTPAPAPAPQQTPAPASTTTGTKTIDHTPGGLPAIPLAVIAGNSTVAGLSAVAVSVGPAAAAATAGTVLLSAVAMKAAGRRAARKTPRRTPNPVRKPAAGTRTNGTGMGGTRRSPAGGGTGGRRSTGSTSTGTGRSTTTRRTPAGTRGTGSTGGRGSVSLRKTPRGATTAKTTGPKSSTTPKTTRPAGGSKTAPHKPASRAAQIKNLRKDKTATAPTRKERRTQDLAARRGLRDARRQDKRAARAEKKGKGAPASAAAVKKLPRTGPTSPALKKQPHVTAPIGPKTAGKTTDTARPTRTDKARTKLRTARDQATQTRAARIRRARHKAKAAAKHAKARTSARTRYGLTAATRGLLAAPIGLLGCLTTPLGKKLGWAWLQYPGRRLYRRLTAKARHLLNARLTDAATAYTSDTQPETLDTTDQTGPAPLADTVARAPRTGHTPDLGDTTDMSEEIKLHFLQTSEETVSAARAYEPGGMLHVRQVIKAMPVALENWAQAFAVLAEKSDAEFPLGNEIGEGMDDIHQQMRALIAHAEELAQTFDRIHEADIERLTNPRKSAEAEKAWDVTRNEDYDAD